MEQAYHKVQLVRFPTDSPTRTIPAPDTDGQSSGQSLGLSLEPSTGEASWYWRTVTDYPNQIEKKKLEYERIREQRRRFELEMQRLDQEYRREARELAQMEEEVRLGGHQSEPTTPPEHHSGFPSIFSRPSRYSMSNLTSPPGFHNRPARSGSQLISPPSGMIQGQGRHAWDDALPSRSTPATRRNSDDEEKDDAFRQSLASHRSAHG